MIEHTLNPQTLKEIARLVQFFKERPNWSWNTGNLEHHKKLWRDSHPVKRPRFVTRREQPL